MSWDNKLDLLYHVVNDKDANALRLVVDKVTLDINSLSRVEFVLRPTPVMLRSGLKKTPVFDFWYSIMLPPFSRNAVIDMESAKAS